MEGMSPATIPQNRQSATAGTLPGPAGPVTLRAVDDELLAGIDRWLAEAGADDRARRDARQAAQVRDLVATAAAGDDLRAALLALADAATAVRVRVAGHPDDLQGRVVAAGEDFVVVRAGPERPPLFVPLGAVSTVTLPAGQRWAGAVIEGETELGPRRRRRGSLRAILAGLATEAPRIQALGPGGPVVGLLRRVGVDHLTVEAEGPPPLITLVPLASLAAVVLLDWA